MCTTAAVLRCCSNNLLCATHFGQHFTIQTNHHPEQLQLQPDPFQNSPLHSELLRRIRSLKCLKSKINSSTSSLIKLIIELKDSILKELNQEIQKYQSMLNTKNLSDPNESKLILKTKMALKVFELDDLSEKIKELFPKKLIEYPDNERKFIRNKFLQTHNGGFRCLAVSNDEKFIVTGSEDATVRVWDFFERKQIFCFAQHKADVNCVAISKDSSFVVSGSEDRSLVLWDLKNACARNVFRGHSGSVESVGLCMDDKIMISGCYNYELMMWNLENFECIINVRTKWAVYSFMIISTEEFYTGTKNLLEKWDIKSCKISLSIPAHNLEINSISKTSTNTYLITGSSDKTVKIWDSSNLQLHSTLSGHSASVNSVCVSPDDSQVISSSSDNTIIIWSLSSSCKTFQFSNHDDFIFSVKCFQDFIVSVSRDARIGITNLSSQSFSSHLHLRPFTVSATNQKSRILAYGSLKTVAIWGLDEEEILLEGHDSLVQAVCFSPDMKSLISASMGLENNLILWDLQERSILKVLAGHEDFVFCVDYSDDGLNAASGDKAGKVLIWNLESKESLCELVGHKDHVYSVKFAKNKKFLVSGGKDQNVIVWDIPGKGIYKVFSGHKDFVWKVLMTEDDKTVVSASLSEGVKGWSVDQGITIFEFKSLQEIKNWTNDYRDMKAEFSRFLF